MKKLKVLFRELILKMLGIPINITEQLEVEVNTVTRLRYMMERDAAIYKRQTEQIARLDRDRSLDTRSSLSLVDVDSFKEVVWISVNDDRLLRYEVFNQVRDYLRGKGKDPLIILTGEGVTLNQLDQEQLKEHGLQRVVSE